MVFSFLLYISFSEQRLRVSVEVIEYSCTKGGKCSVNLELGSLSIKILHEDHAICLDVLWIRTLDTMWRACSEDGGWQEDKQQWQLTELTFLRHQCQHKAHSTIALETSGRWQDAQNSNAAYLGICVKLLRENCLSCFGGALARIQ